jgi:quercetin dioxygenase-like cupin family protein
MAARGMGVIIPSKGGGDMYFYDLDQIDPQKLPGHERRLVVGKNLMLVFIDAEVGKTTEHTHPNEQMLYLIEGRASFHVGSEERIIEAGQVVHIPEGTPHRLEAHTRIRYLGIYSPPREALIKGAG